MKNLQYNTLRTWKQMLINF